MLWSFFLKVPVWVHYQDPRSAGPEMLKPWERSELSVGAATSLSAAQGWMYQITFQGLNFPFLLRQRLFVDWEFDYSEQISRPSLSQDSNQYVPMKRDLIKKKKRRRKESRTEALIQQGFEYSGSVPRYTNTSWGLIVWVAFDRIAHVYKVLWA